MFSNHARFLFLALPLIATVAAGGCAQQPSVASNNRTLYTAPRATTGSHLPTAGSGPSATSDVSAEDFARTAQRNQTAGMGRN